MPLPLSIPLARRLTRRAVSLAKLTTTQENGRRLIPSCSPPKQKQAPFSCLCSQALQSGSVEAALQVLLRVGRGWHVLVQGSALPPWENGQLTHASYVVKWGRRSSTKSKGRQASGEMHLQPDSRQVAMSPRPRRNSCGEGKAKHACYCKPIAEARDTKLIKFNHVQSTEARLHFVSTKDMLTS
ncbi:hypothetical protein BX600DRAFT_75838 [Xylariales sp. PMI_506]|nr:hypothetical protein BX600DRAFT_75838 [Xylariales sp. PMI_506]